MSRPGELAGGGHFWQIWCQLSPPIAAADLEPRIRRSFLVDSSWLLHMERLCCGRSMLFVRARLPDV